ncbi:MAG: response regulator [Gemmatimonadaceae bacterium]
MTAVQIQTHEASERVVALAQTVLLVDDDADMRLYLRSCLKSSPSTFTRVIEAGDGLEALRLIRSGEVDLVICDVGLPGLDGLRLCRAIRTDSALSHVIVLLISGEAVNGDGGADGFLTKPFNSQQLLAALAALRPRPDRPT